MTLAFHAQKISVRTSLNNRFYLKKAVFIDGRSQVLCKSPTDKANSSLVFDHYALVILI